MSLANLRLKLFRKPFFNQLRSHTPVVWKKPNVAATTHSIEQKTRCSVVSNPVHPRAIGICRVLTTVQSTMSGPPCSPAGPQISWAMAVRTVLPFANSSRKSGTRESPTDNAMVFSWSLAVVCHPASAHAAGAQFFRSSRQTIPIPSLHRRNRFG